MASTQKGAEEEGRTIVWADESGFYLLPAVVRSYAPRGHTPTLRVPLTHDHRSVISGITPAGQLFSLVQDRAFRGPDIVRFLKHLLRHLSGQLLVIWTAHPSIARSRSRTSWLKVGRRGSIWSSFLGTLLT